MFRYLKKRKHEAAKKEALEIASRVVERFNESLEAWRATSLEMRRTMTEDFFVERMLQIQPEAELSFQMVAEIEAIACVKSWVSERDEHVEEFWNRISEEDREILAFVGVMDEAEGHLLRVMTEVYDELDGNLSNIIEEAVIRRGETPEA